MKNCILGIVIFLFIFAIQIQADVYMKYKQHTDGMAVMGQQQPAKDIIQKVWITKNKIKSESDDQTVFVFSDEKKMIVLNHKEKTYSEMPMGAGKIMDKAMEGKSAQEKQEMQGVMQSMKGMMNFEITVPPTGETKKINQWNCKKYNQEVKMVMGPISSDIWATEELKMDYELYAQFSTAMMSMNPGFSDSFDKAIKEMKKIKGIPVLTETVMNMMGMQMKSSQELLEFKEEAAPKGTFDIPKGYKKVDMMQGY